MVTKRVIAIAALLLLAGCSDGEETIQSSLSVESGDSEKEEVVEKKADASDQEQEIESQTDEGTTDTTEESEEPEKLEDAYSAQEIEYARVWLNFGANQEVDRVYYEILPAGTPIIPEIEGSAVYPEEVMRLEGSRQVDGAITYSGNGDGTINLYQVPYNWNISTEIEEAIYIQESEKVLETLETDYIEPMEDSDVSYMIEKLVRKNQK